MIEQLMFLSCA